MNTRFMKLIPVLALILACSRASPAVEPTPSPSARPGAQAADTDLSDPMLNEALGAVVAAVKLDRSFDVPYLAGYSRDGETVYIDRHVPRALYSRGRLVDVYPFLILHEMVEKSLEDKLHLRYQHAHQLALRAERDAVLAAGVSWEDYDRFMQRYIAMVADNAERVPPDLDLKPYQDENDNELLERMLESMRRQSK